MVVEFIIEPKIMKYNLVTSIFNQELKAFKKEILEGKVFITEDDDKIVINITDDKLEKEFIDGFSKTREKYTLYILNIYRSMISLLYDSGCRPSELLGLKDKKEIKLW